MVLIALIGGALHEKSLLTSDRCSALEFGGCERTVMLEGLPPSTPMGYLYDIYIYMVGGFNHLETYENQWEG